MKEKLVIEIVKKLDPAPDLPISNVLVPELEEDFPLSAREVVISTLVKFQDFSPVSQPSVFK